MKKERTHDSSDESNRRLGMPLPRTARSRHRSKLDRGLASDVELEKLASSYLDMQRSLWPNLAKNGTLPEASPSIMRAMVQDFKTRHRTGHVDPAAVLHLMLQELKLGGNDDRYSCANSKPTSILDQMVRSLRCAREKESVIPWSYVFADHGWGEKS